MDLKGMPLDLKQQIRKHFEYLYMRQRGRSEQQILAELPLSLRDELLDLNTWLLAKVPFPLPIRPFGGFFGGAALSWPCGMLANPPVCS